jgi:SPP1 gp7 family putative phage head morphogenesis protein
VTPAIAYPTGEAPKYQALRRAIQLYYTALQRPLTRLRTAVFGALAFHGTKAADDEAFDFTDADAALIDAALDLFLEEMAGTNRTALGFAAGDGVLQEQNTALFATGLRRGAQLAEAAPTLRGERESPAVREMLNNAFARLSEKGALRLEGIRDEIHGVLTAAQEAGLSPLETARQLGAQFDEYSGYEFERLARTESAFAAEAGTRAQMADLGVEQVEWLISADACPICQDLADGGPYALDDEENLPPAHPNCLCSVAPVTPDADPEAAP